MPPDAYAFGGSLCLWQTKDMQTTYNNGRVITEELDMEKLQERYPRADVDSVKIFKGTVRTIAGTKYIEDEHGTLHKLTE